MTSFTSRFITANGIRIHYWREGSGAPLLLLDDAADLIADLDQALAAV